MAPYSRWREIHLSILANQSCISKSEAAVPTFHHREQIIRENLIMAARPVLNTSFIVDDLAVSDNEDDDGSDMDVAADEPDSDWEISDSQSSEEGKFC